MCTFCHKEVRKTKKIGIVLLSGCSLANVVSEHNYLNITRPSVRVHWVACGTCTVQDNFF